MKNKRLINLKQAQECKLFEFDFEEPIKTLCRNVARKLYALERTANFIDLQYKKSSLPLNHNISIQLLPTCFNFALEVYQQYSTLMKVVHKVILN